MISSPEAVERCVDKQAFGEFLKVGDFPSIETEISIEKVKGPKYVVKERYGAGYGRIGLNLSKGEAVEFGKTLKEPIFQPYIEGEEWSVDVYRSKRGKVKGIVARRRELIANGESQITSTASFSDLERLSADLADHLDIYGHAVIQVLVDSSGKFHIIECNPRFGGASTASLAVGLDSFYWFLTEAIGIDIEDYPFNRSSTEIRQVRHPQDWIIPCQKI